MWDFEHLVSRRSEKRERYGALFHASRVPSSRSMRYKMSGD
jgi:hypothetical protein